MITDRGKPSVSSQTRLVQLDILRGIAVLLVLGRHIPMTQEPVRGFLGWWMRAGWTGVDLFFVLSGFLVSGLLFQEYKRHGDIRLGRFFIRRGLKIYPAFYVLFFVTLF